MRMALLTLVLIGCAPTPARAPLREPDVASAVDAIDAPGSLAHLYDRAGRPLDHGAAPEADAPPNRFAPTDRFAPRRIAEPRALRKPASTRRAGLHDVHLRGARLDTALQTLAKLSGYGVVIESELPTPVTLELESVEPYDALVALAEAHDVDVARDGDVLIFRPASAP
jgi:hypothetical protein